MSSPQSPCDTLLLIAGKLCALAAEGGNRNAHQKHTLRAQIAQLEQQLAEAKNSVRLHSKQAELIRSRGPLLEPCEALAAEFHEQQALRIANDQIPHLYARKNALQTQLEQLEQPDEGDTFVGEEELESDEK